MLFWDVMVRLRADKSLVHKIPTRVNRIIPAVAFASIHDRRDQTKARPRLESGVELTRVPFSRVGLRIDSRPLFSGFVRIDSRPLFLVLAELGEQGLECRLVADWFEVGIGLDSHDVLPASFLGLA
jgi:hypothetical protein